VSDNTACRLFPSVRHYDGGEEHEKIAAAILSLLLVLLLSTFSESTRPAAEDGSSSDISPPNEKSLLAIFHLLLGGAETDNGVPVANSQVVTLDEDTSVAITLTGSDPDEDR
jgi:hypothetical protein